MDAPAIRIHLGAPDHRMEMIKPTGHWASFWYEDGEEKGMIDCDTADELLARVGDGVPAD